MNDNKPYPAAIYYEPDGYEIKNQELVGRRMAGSSFLEAVAKDNQGTEAPLLALTPRARSYQSFTKAVRDIDTASKTEWVPPHRLHRLKEAGLLYMGDPNIHWMANLRLRWGIDAFSLCGITHTTASDAVMTLFKDIMTAPVMPWDAIICTSQSVRASVQAVLDAEMDYLKWRLGNVARPQLCQFPVIPLGVHVNQFARLKAKRAPSRQSLGIADDEIVVLYVGRFSPHAKVHPLAMYQSLEKIAKKTQKPITLLECGWSAQAAIDEMMDEARRTIAPSVRSLQIDGREMDKREACFACADIFMSLSDNIQETFGLTPVEAMAAGLPVIISDWDGYAELIEDGQQGFKIATAMPTHTSRYAHLYEAQSIIYQRYCASMAQVTSVDHKTLENRLENLVCNPDLRQKMRDAGLMRAKVVFDWPVIFKQYKALWAELAERRQAARGNPEYSDLFTKSPTCLSSRQAPSLLFPTYPTQQVTERSRVKLSSPTARDDYNLLKNLKIMDLSKEPMPNDQIVYTLFDLLEDHGDASLAELRELMPMQDHNRFRLIGILLKMGCLELTNIPDVRQIKH